MTAKKSAKFGEYVSCERLLFLQSATLFFILIVFLKIPYNEIFFLSMSRVQYIVDQC